MTKLTPAEFIAKFPLASRNINCLEDIACPECGNRDNFQILMSGMFDVSDDGTGDHYDTEWGPESPCRCRQCQAAGQVCDFTIAELDKAMQVLGL